MDKTVSLKMCKQHFVYHQKAKTYNKMAIDVLTCILYLKVVLLFFDIHENHMSNHNLADM